MSKDIASAVLTSIQNEVTTLACCVEIQRADGRVYRMTDHNVDIVFEGGTYDASLPFSIGNIDTSAGMAVDNTNLRLFCDGTTFVLDDFKNKRFDNARIKIFYLDHTAPSNGGMIARKGWFGTLKWDQNEVVDITVFGLMKIMDFDVPRVYQPLCDATFGDSRCKVAVDLLQARDYNSKYFLGDWAYVYDTTQMTALSVTNGGFESDGAVSAGGSITGWTALGTHYFAVSAATGGLSPHTGSYMLRGGADGGDDDNGYVSTIYQDIDVSGAGTTELDDGRIVFALFAKQAAYTNLNSGVKIRCEALDANGNEIDYRDKDYEFLDTASTWRGRSVVMPLLQGTRTVRVKLSFAKIDDTEPRCALDAISAYYYDHTTDDPTDGLIHKVETVSIGDGVEIGSAWPNGSFEADGAIALGADPAITDWTIITPGTYAQVSSSVHGLSAQHGTYFLAHGSDGGGVQHSTSIYRRCFITKDLEQDPLNVAYYPIYPYLRAAEIDAGEAHGKLLYDLGFGDAGLSSASVGITFLEEDGTSISSIVLKSLYSTGSTGWTQEEDSFEIPPLTRAMQIVLTMTSPAASDAGTTAFDDIRVQFFGTQSQYGPSPSGGDGNSGTTFTTTASETTSDGELLWRAYTKKADFDLVASVTDKKNFVATAMAGADANFRTGKITWISGDNAGVESLIRIWDSGTKAIELYYETPAAIQAGDRFFYTEGCGKQSQEDCKTRFSNMVNFRGFPHVPGRFIEEEQQGDSPDASYTFPITPDD